jgi:hypothetical protein
MARALMYMDDSSGVVGDDLHEIISRWPATVPAGHASVYASSLPLWVSVVSASWNGWSSSGHRPLTRSRGAAGFAVRDLREQLAEVSGDLDRYVAVLAEHLTSAIQYERSTLALRAAGRRAEAIDWARRGLAAKPGWPHADRLRDTLVDMLLDEGSTEAALAVRRAEFQRHPTATAYHHLADTATKTWAEDPTPWALELLNDRVATQPVSPASWSTFYEPLARTSRPGRWAGRTATGSASGNGWLCSNNAAGRRCPDRPAASYGPWH